MKEQLFRSECFALLSLLRGDSEWNDWRWQLKNMLDASSFALKSARERELISRYPFRVTPYYLSLADFSDPSDPILRQILPDIRELIEEEGIGDDPFAEDESAPDGMVHRFPDRLLVMGSALCSANCRHCTRKNILNGANTVWESGLDSMQRYLREHPVIREVIVSGGDPLLLSDDTLKNLLFAIREVPTVEVVRIGTRVPVTLPMRVTSELCAVLREFKSLWVNTQFNHPSELTEEAAGACGKMIDAGIPVSNQSVLLRGVNDSEECMISLCAALQRSRVRPYYTFVCDPVRGTSDFRVGKERAKEILYALESALGGLAVPRFVMDIPGAVSKVRIQ